MALRQLRSRQTACRLHVRPHRHGQNERCGPTGLTCRYPRPLAEHPIHRIDELLLWDLATSFGPDQSSSLTVAATSHLFTPKYAADKLCDDEQWLGPPDQHGSRRRLPVGLWYRRGRPSPPSAAPRRHHYNRKGSGQAPPKSARRSKGAAPLAHAYSTSRSHV
jgi:hypothetical protein